MEPESDSNKAVFFRTALEMPGADKYILSLKRENTSSSSIFQKLSRQGQKR